MNEESPPLPAPSDAATTSSNVGTSVSEESQSSAVAAPLAAMSLNTSNGKKKTWELTANDVLLGRGPGLSMFAGNLRFRELCDERKDQYQATSNRKQKKGIANQVFNIVRSRGGRFLKQEAASVNFNSGWYEAGDDVAIEKCKQSLREIRGDERASSRTRKNSSASDAQNNTSSHDPSMGSAQGLLTGVTFPGTGQEAHSLPTGTLPLVSGASAGIPVTTNAGVDPLLAQSNIHSALDPRLLLFCETPSILQQAMISQSLLTNPVLSSPFLATGTTLQGLQQQDVSQLISNNLAAHQRHLADQAAVYSMLRDFSRLQCASAAARDSSSKRTLDELMLESVMEDCEKNSVDTTRVAKAPVLSDTNEVDSSASSSPSDDEAPSSETEEDEVAAFLLSSLAFVGRPVITAEQEASELETLTNEERASILADAFGDMCAVSPHQSKKAKRDLDQGSIAFLVRQMRLELEKIPPNKKAALTEALSKAQAEEFSDERLEKFLRVEGMNAKLAAQRFNNYWTARRHAFGPKKYLMKMTLGEALKDDLVALKSCCYTLLPHKDVSGRTLLYMEPHRHTRKGYTSESMLRAIWYVAEVAAEENTDISGGIVQVCWFNNASIFDYDLTVFDRWAFFLSSCWPIKLLTNHLCCPTAVVNRIVKPIVHTFVSKDWRARTLTHNVPVTEILSVLERYGIGAYMLPTEMGGTESIDMSKWMANRRAVELEEIS